MKTVTKVILQVNHGRIEVFSNDPDMVVETVNDFAFMEECGCCSSFHRRSWSGDCRNDDERFVRVE